MYKTLSFPLNVYAKLLQLDNIPVKYLHFGLFQSQDEDVYAAQQHSTEKVLQYLPEPPAKILEIGMGLGTMQKTLLEKGFLAQGMTPDKAQYDIALNKIGSRAQIHQLRFEDFATDDRFDAIISQESAQYIDLLDLLSGVNSLLKTGGQFILIDEVSLNPRQAGFEALHNPDHIRYMAQCIGFEVCFEEDLSHSAKYTMEYLQTQLAKHRNEILQFINNNDTQLIELENSIRHYIESYENQSYGYRLMVFTKKNNSLKNIQTLGSAQLSEFQRLFNECFSHPMSDKLWQWKYQHNTAHSIGYWKQSQLVGHYGGFARDILYFGQAQKAVQVGDTMVAHKERANFTKNGIFHQLARIFLQRFIGFGAPYLVGFGFPNSRVMKLAEKLGLYQSAGHFTQLSWQTNAIKPHPLYKLRHLSDLDESIVNTLWQQMASDTNEHIIAVRDWKRIQYRYLQHPEIHYEVLKLCHRFTNKPIAIIILKLDKTQYQLVDFICRVKNISLVLRSAMRFTQQAEQSGLYTLISETMKPLFTAYPFVETDPQITIPHSACTAGPALDEVKNKWWLMAGDSDFM